jgi:PAS domain S-box-containing protein
MEDDEARLLAQRSAALQARARVARLAAWTGVLVALGLAVLASVLVGREMAARQRAEQTLGKTQTRFQQMLASSTAVIYANVVSGTTFSPSWVSENVTRITGYGADEPLHPAWWLNNLHPDDRARVLADMPALFANGQLTTEYRFRGKDGVYRWVHDEARLLRDAAGQPIEVVGSWVDITDRREAEASLRASEERLRLLVGSVRDYAIYMLDADGHVRSWNAGARHIKGYTEAEILGRHFSRFYTPEDVAAGRPAAALRAAVTDGKFEEENWRVRKDGSHFWANVVITAVRDDRGALLGFAKVTRDLTERKQGEEKLRRYAAELEAANKELEAFSYSVSHDLRAPLRSLDGFSQALLEDYGDRLDDTGRDFLRRVRAGSQRMATLIDDLLGLSRVTRAELHVGEVDLSALAAALAADLEKADPERAVTFTIAPGLIARADPGLMRVALQNLLGNAWKFTGKRSPAHVEVGAMAHNGGRAFFVRDDGAGFDMAHAAKLFGAFQRLHGFAEFPGSGIGLATVQRIIHRHGGQVWAEGAPDRGATFYFTL